MKNDIRFATKDDNNEVRNLWDACFEEDSVNWRDWYFQYSYSPENTILLFEDNNLASMIQMNPYSMYINNKIVKAASLAGVATYEKYRKKGYAGRLIETGLFEMQKRGVVFSFLYPFNYDFYRKFGYELCYNRKVYKTSLNDNNDYNFIEIDSTHDVTKLYSKYCEDLNGYIIRDNDYMRIKFKEHFADNNKIYLIKKCGKEIGYVMLRNEENILVADELITKDLVGVANAISSKFNLPLEFESPYDIKDKSRELKSHCMGRVIDIYTLFNGIKSKKIKIKINVIDNIINKNNNILVFDGMSGYLKISSTKEKADFKLDIKELAQIGMGFQKGMSDNANEVYNLIFEDKISWIKEVC